MKARSSFGRQAKERLAVTKDLTSLPIQYLCGRYSDFLIGLATPSPTVID